jgi:cytochrome c oxidase assembly protein subunit 15
MDWRLDVPEDKRRQIRLWLAAVAAATFLVVIVGGITRLTHSGLSIVDWQPLIGVVPPLTQSQWIQSFERYQQFPEYRQLRPDMTLAEYKQIFFWEYLHRVLARLIGLVFLVPFVFFHVTGALTAPLARRALALFGLGTIQGIAGWVMVRSGLVDRPSVSHYRLAVHLLIAMAIFGLCVWLIRDLSVRRAHLAVSAVARRRASRALVAVGCLLALQIVWGAFVAGLKAGFVFNTFPLMGGTLVPATYWTLSPVALNLLQHVAGVQWMHRVLGTLLVIAAGVSFLRIRRMRMGRVTTVWCGALLVSVAAQYGLGVLTLLRLVPLELAVAHQAMAVAIVGLWVGAMHDVRSPRAAPTGGDPAM